MSKAAKGLALALNGAGMLYNYVGFSGRTVKVEAIIDRYLAKYNKRIVEKLVNNELRDIIFDNGLENRVSYVNKKEAIEGLTIAINEIEVE